MAPHLLAVTLALSCLQALAAGAPHRHGVVSLSATLEGQVLSLDLQAPLDSLLGFERAPRTAAERAGAAALLDQLDPGSLLFQANPEAGCVPTRADVKAAVLQGSMPPVGGHADLEAAYQFRCERPEQLASIRHGLFGAFRRIQRIEVQFALPAGQGRRVLKRPEAILALKR